VRGEMYEDPSAAGARPAARGARIEPLFPGSRLLRSVQEQAETITRERDRVLAEAKSEADRILAEARVSAEHAARDAAQQASESAAARIDAAASVLIRAAESVDRAVAFEADRLAIKIARSLLNAEIRSSPGVLESFIVETVRAADAHGRVRVALHPSVAGHVLQRELLRGAEAVEIVADDSMALGDVRIETGLGEIRDSIESRLADLESRLIASARDGGESP